MKNTVSKMLICNNNLLLKQITNYEIMNTLQIPYFHGYARPLNDIVLRKH